jgi:2Fe-2S ferredoxin
MNVPAVEVTITVKPSGLAFRGRPGQILMEAANAAGLYWPTICGGEGRCLVCMLATDPNGGDALTPAGDLEAETLRRVGRSPSRFRLACAARLTGRDVIVTHRNVRNARAGDRMPFAHE